MSNAQQINFYANRRFKYGEGYIEKDQQWTPQGGKWDDQIIAAAMDGSNKSFSLVRAEIVDHPNRGLRRRKQT